MKEKSFPEFRSLLNRVDVDKLGVDKLDHFRHTGVDGNRERCVDDKHK